MKQTPQTVSPMSNEARNTYVIRGLTDALLALLAEKPLSEITISALCARAGVSRASFYRNFADKEAVLKAHIEQLFRDWGKAYERSGADSLGALIGALFTHFETHHALYSLLNERGLVYLLKDVVIGLCGPKPEYDKVQAYASAFVAYSLYGWIEVWFQRGMRESAAEMAQLFQNVGKMPQ